MSSAEQVRFKGFLELNQTLFKSLILAQDECWRCALSMQVER